MLENAQNARSWVARFRAALTTPAAHYPVFAPDQWTLNQPGSAGIAYWLRPRDNETPWPQTWFTDTQTFKHQPDLPWKSSELYAVVYWPRFLSAAQSHHYSPVRPLAVQLWFLLRHHVAAFDQMFADELGVWAAHYLAHPELQLENPQYFGATSAADVKRFDAHSAALLRDDDFNRYVAKVTRGLLKSAASQNVLYEVGACSNPGCSGSHRRFCTACKARKAVRWHGTAIALRHLRFDTGMRWTMPPAEPAPLRNSTPLAREVAYFAAGLTPEDGAVVDGSTRKPLLIISLETVLLRLMTTKRESVFSHFLENAYPETLWTQAVVARRFLDTKLETCLPSQRPAARELCDKHGFPWANEIEHSLGIYDYNAVRHWLDKQGGLDQRHRATLLARARAKRLTLKPERRVALLDYRDGQGNTRQLQVFRHQNRYFFQPPEPVPTGDYPREYARLHKGQFHFTVLGASRVLSPDKYPWAGHWVSWLQVNHASFDAKDFAATRYNNQYSQRVLDVAAGKAKRLGPFAGDEIARLDAFLRTRPPRKGFSEAEWADLAALLPTRSRQAIRNQVHALGFQFALRNGWVSYVNSPYCLQVSSARRRRWAKDGVET